MSSIVVEIPKALEKKSDFIQQFVQKMITDELFLEKSYNLFHHWDARDQDFDIDFRPLEEHEITPEIKKLAEEAKNMDLSEFHNI